MAKKRPSTQKRQREYQKREREIKKAEKAAIKRNRRHNREYPDGPPLADDGRALLGSDDEIAAPGE